MSDVINSIFGRPKNENTGSGGYAYGTVEPAPEVAEAPAESAPTADEAGILVEETESAPEAEAAAETAEDEAADSDQAEDDAEDESDEDKSGEDAAEADETSDEDVTGTDEEAVAEDTDTDAAETEPVTETEPAEAEPVSETEPVAETVEAEPVAETEPVVAEAVTAEADAPAARPAAGSRGSTTIADGVVGKIVVRIAAQTEGVHSVAEDGITVELADDVAWVTIPVVVEFGHAVKALGEQIRVAVIDAVEQYLGLDVEVVDVHVTDIHFPEAD